MKGIRMTVNDTAQADELERLLARVALKDQSALEALYTTCGGRLNGIARKLVHDSDLANDILQETFLQIWHKAGEYRRDLGEPMTWMTSILRYRTLDRLRADQRERKRREQYEEVSALFPGTGAVSPLSHLLDEASGAQLGICLNQLENPRRNAILMAYYYGFSREDIASHLEQPINTIKSWLRRSLVRLAECLAQ